MQNDLELGLFENAIDSLECALENYEKAVGDENSQEKHFKQSLLNIGLYVELSFKFFISEFHPLLIYKDAFSDKKKLDKTISLDESINFMFRDDKYKDFQTTDFKRHLKSLQDIYNQVKHHKLKTELRQFNLWTGEVLYVIDKLYSVHKTNISTIIANNNKALEATYINVLANYNNELLLIKQAEAKANKKAEKFIQVTKYDDPLADYAEAYRYCPHCNNHTLVYDEESEEFHCTYADCSLREKGVRCEGCNQLILLSESYESIGEDYHWCSEERGFKS